MRNPSRGELIRSWLRYHECERHDRPGDQDPDWWAVEEVMHLVLVEPDEAWNLMTDLLRSSETEWQVVMIGCRVLEDLLYMNPDRYMNALEEAAPTNRRILAAAACVWLDDEPAGPRIATLLSLYDQPRK